MAQNRAHFVNSSTHPQFKALDSWIVEHGAELHAILEGPGRRVLYGEWLYARHSIWYTNLPSYFLAFDIYDCQRACFLSRTERQAVLASTSIQPVPLLAKQVFLGPDQLRALLNQPSLLAPGSKVEGIYLRVDETSRLKSRAKLVRPDFIQGITAHWMKQALVRNKLQF